MNIASRIAGHFEQAARLQLDAAELLAPAIGAAAESIVAALLDDKKVLVCGDAGSSLLAEHFAACMLNRYEMDRPGLAALVLSHDRGGLDLCLGEGETGQRHARKLLALGHHGDVFLVICSCGNDPDILGAMRAAHEREMPVIALTGGDGGKLMELLRPGDIHIGVPHDHAARLQEVYLLTLHCLCDAIDSLLMGVE